MNTPNKIGQYSINKPFELDPLYQSITDPDEYKIDATLTPEINLDLDFCLRVFRR